MVKLLLDAGADANLKDVEEKTPLHEAASHGTLETVKLLLDANVKGHFGLTPLQVAIRNSSPVGPDIVKLLLHAGADVNARYNSRLSPLVAAVYYDNSEMVKILIGEGANVNVKNCRGTPLLYEAARERNSGIVKLLLDAGADVNEKNRHGWTSLHVATSWSSPNSPDLVKLLLDAGANVNVINDDGDTATTMCVKVLYFDDESEKKNLKFLIEYSDVNLKDKKGKIILCEILNNEKTKTLVSKIILEHIAQLKSLNYHVDLALLEAISREHDLNDYFTACTEELKKAKSTKLKHCWVTFLNLLVDDECKFVKYAGNQDLVKDFEIKVKEFPIYGATMKSNVTTGIDSRKFYDRATNILSFNLPIFNPTHLIIRDSLDTLKLEDWKKLCD